MLYPRIREHAHGRDIVQTFGGYNHNLRIAEGEFYDMTNMTSSDYPVLSPRKPRGIYKKDVNALGIISKEEFCYADGENFVIGDTTYPMGLTAEEKTLISMGAYVIIMPDKKYINTAKPEDRGDIEATMVTSGEVTFSLCTLDGVEYNNITVSATEPSRVNMAYWLDTSSKPNVLKQYSSASGMWVSVSSTYVKIAYPGIGNTFAKGDGISISDIESELLSDLNSSMVVQASSEDYIVVVGIIQETVKQDTPITIARRMPEMDFIIESDNRLWGCRYGKSIDGEHVNEIYASKLGDFKNWNSFSGISTDSYVVSVGSDGPFTGAITHLGYPLFFKENTLHKIYGSMPSNYQVQTTTVRGVQKGCAKSLSIVNEILYYKARSAVCAYDGSLPVEMSSALGEVAYESACAGTLGNKYYISMRSKEDGKYHLFVYDTKKGLWHREDNEKALAFAEHGGVLYYIDEHNNIKTTVGDNVLAEDRVKWSAETGLLGVNDPDKKYISRIDIRMSMSVSSYVDLYIEYDSSGEWEKVFSMYGDRLRSFSIPIKAKRSDHIRIKIEGLGNAKIFSICKTIEGGSGQ